MKKEEILREIARIQNEKDWNKARISLANLLHLLETAEEFEFTLAEISSRDWFF